MKVTLKNNSCSRIRRVYPKFEVDVPGYKTVTIPVPDEHVEGLKRYLKTHHPAVELTVEEGEHASLATPVATSVAATTNDSSVIGINIDDQQESQETTVTVEQHLRSLGLISDPAPDAPAAPVSEAAPVKDAPEVPKAEKKKHNLIPAKPKGAKAKPAKSTGGTK